MEKLVLEKVKKNQVNTSTLLRCADNYNRVGTMLLQDTRNGVVFLEYSFSPCVVNLSLACELYIKYLLIKKCVV